MKHYYSDEIKEHAMGMSYVEESIKAFRVFFWGGGGKRETNW